ncbi:MAG: ATP-binding cassette domain-containing protein [Armatimonadota bacterium]|nr:ATP-binding cassette domain-containing protein [Armatimonadota bacterium]MDR7455228.1 ATP-binding cassette domain-containing protein [Armatimonadota bacterium]MDR7456508.1 ATP-binding cassette domain-containing protein [Armatimonadota bacterium]MDR7496225.1 ATP-binding cassette domain-containing protein [Armatimonadota bacterium]MDR7511799.1 ATP-binding cassette domain-containing protein [Armatimonadota bacterium]
MPAPALPAPPADAPAPNPVVVAVRDVWKSFGAKTALAGVSLEVRRGEVQVIMGPSGCGKSVLLKHLVALLRPDRGEIWVFDRPVHALPDGELDALRIRMGVVFQSAALFDSMSVGDNVAFPLRRHRRLAPETVARRVAELLAMVEMDGTEALLPAALSGGMRKRVGIARALALDPALILYDEPTSGLDPLTARTVDDLILRLRRDLGVTSVVVTHSVDSAFRLADRLAVMEAGRLLASGTPAEIVASGHPFIKQFLDTRAIEVKRT